MNDDAAANGGLPVSAAEIDELRRRVSRLARDNAWLRLVTSMLARLSAADGLNQVVDTILAVLMETIGGSNLTVYYAMGGRWHAKDLFHGPREMEAPDDPSVARALRERVFVRTDFPAVPGPAGPPAMATFVYPLVVQQRVIGAVAMEGMQLTSAEIQRELQPFFVYAALMLASEISNYRELERAHEGLLAAHRTLQRETEARLAAEEHYRILFEQSPDGVVLVDPETRGFVRFNRVAHEQLGYAREEFEAVTLSDLEARDGDGVVGRRVAQFLGGGDQSFETVHVAKDGSLRDVVVKGRVLELDRRPLILAILRDVTDAKKLEGELLRAQKLESIGVLAGGIAHDFNNYLMAILGSITLAREFVPAGSGAIGLLGECQEACNRARELTQQLLTFAKGGAPVKALTRVGDLVRESALFASRGTGLRCVFSIPDDLWSADVDRGQISQVVHNLVINAAQAMPGGGDLEVRAANVPGPPRDLVQLEIEDHGVGIPASHLPRIFDPYFSTKQRGSGLGLASAYSIVSRHDGRILVRSEPGAGTTFTILLPGQRLAPAPERPPEDAAPPRGRRVLLMDDDEMVARVVSRMLRQLACEVERTRDGMEAIAAYERAIAAGTPFELVILDLTVPGGMGGREALARLRQIDPAVRAIVSSGYSSDATASECEAAGFVGVLRKPYTLQEVRRVLADLAG